METTIVRLDYENTSTATECAGMHDDVINEYVLNGYSLTGFVPLKFESGGKLLSVELVFRK